MPGGQLQFVWYLRTSIHKGQMMLDMEECPVRYMQVLDKAEHYPIRCSK
jgi:hypothetical protein